jgi:uncharacterized membrane protein
MAANPVYDAVGTSVPPLVEWTRSLEQARVLDLPARLLGRVAGVVVADPARRDLLQGKWLGHALHPVLTDLPIGFWTSATVLDLVGGKRSRPAATTLVALGVLTAVPAIVTGYAEYAETEQRDKRVGFVHAATNASAVVLFASSLKARRSDRHGPGVLLALAGTSAATVGGFLGGHLSAGRKVGTRHPAFERG